MIYVQTQLDGVWMIKPEVYTDERGYFMETFKADEFEKQIDKVWFVQENESRSSFGVIRGLHLQRGEAGQAKLVRVVQGQVFDVAVDLRPSSPTFGQYISVLLSEENKHQLFIPRGFAHGFAVLSESATLQYKVDNPYCPKSELTLAYDDARIGIDWPLSPAQIKLSPKDRKGMSFSDLIPLL